MERAEQVVQTTMTTVGQFGQILAQLLDSSGKIDNHTLKEIFSELEEYGVVPVTTEIENKDVKRFESAAVKNDIVVKSFKLGTDADRDVVTYMFNKNDQSKIADILHELGIEVSREKDKEKVDLKGPEDYILNDAQAAGIFGKDGGHYIAKVENLTLTERYHLQRALAEEKILSHASVNQKDGAYSVEVLETNKDKLHEVLAKTEMNLAMFPKQYERAYEHYNMLNTIVKEPGKAAGMVIFDSKNPSKSIEFLKDGVKIYNDYGKTQVNDFSLRKPDVDKDILNVVYSFAVPDAMKKEDYDKADVADLHRYEAKEMNEVAFVSSRVDHYHEKHRMEELKAEEKMSINVNGRNVLYYNAEQTIGEFFDKEAREDIRDVSFDVKLAEIDDIVNDRISAMVISTEMYVVQDLDREVEMVPEVGDLVPELGNEEIGDNEDTRDIEETEERDDEGFGFSDEDLL